MDEIERLKSENEKLKAFAREIFDDIWNGDCLDTMDLEYLGKTHGIIVEYPATEKDVEDTEFQVGDAWHKYSDWMQRGDS